jgi:hypothetical protein
MGWPLIISAIIVACVYIGAGIFGQTPSGRTTSTSV